mmetsp:Transcript_29202/g.82395  ORF Transcript_29202/g.82395 Transcript_29202/m.82395 type:complete len:231 (+) Transcript_29202:454-1146(+)
MSNYANHSPMSGYHSSLHDLQWDGYMSAETGYVTSGVVFLGGTAITLALLTSLATGLFYLAELVEEHTKTTKKILRHTIHASVVVQLLLLVVDRMPAICIAAGILAQLSYYQLLKGFPFIPLTDIRFMFSSVMLVINHCCWMRHFLSTTHSMEWICSFFFLAVWMVPFGFMMSLVSLDSVLPGGANPIPKAGKGKSTKSTMLQFFTFARSKTDQLLPNTCEAFQPHGKAT